MDDLLDLNWSSSSPAGSSKSTATPTTSQTPKHNSNSSSNSTAFDFLTLPAPGAIKSASLNAASRSSTPNYYSTPPLRSTTPNTAPIPQNATFSNPPGKINGAPSVGQSSQSDAFSGLLSLGGSGGVGGSSGKTMSMAEKQKQMEEAKKRALEHERAQFDHGDFWDKHESGSHSNGHSNQRNGNQKNATAGFGGFDDLLAPTPTSSSRIQGSPKSTTPIPVILAPTPSAVPKKHLTGSSSTSNNSTGGKLGGAAGGSLWSNPAFFEDTPKSTSSSPAPSPAAVGGPLSAKAAPMGTNQTQSKSPAPVDIFDFDALHAATTGASGTSRGSTRSASRGNSGMRTPVSDFDFGERMNDSGNGSGGYEEEGDPDFLGDLAKPITQTQRRPVENVEPIPQSPNRRPGNMKKSSARSNSPPPHIVGQIVEMGFSPAQARSALAKTNTGMDVEAAMEFLLGDSGGRNGSSGSTRIGRDDIQDLSEPDEDRIEEERRHREEERRERQRARRAGPSRDTITPRTREELDRARSPSGKDNGEAGLATDKYLAQASEIGQNMFSKASSFWAAGKEKALKVYEEQRKALEAQQNAQRGKSGDGRDGRGGAAGPSKDGRPRWMIEAEQNGWKDDEEGSPTASTGQKVPGGEEFRDDDYEEVSPPRPRRTESKEARRVDPRDMPSKPVRQEGPKQEPERYVSSRERADLLFAEEPKAYKSPARHRKPTQQSYASASRVETPRVSTPVPKITRKLVEASPNQVRSAASHKAKGNEHFKLGRFTEAEMSYTAAISSLPEGHLLLIPLWNNRAATRLKLGSSDEAAADSTLVIETVGFGYHPHKETPLPSEYAEVKLGEALAKAITKRAQAWEMGEKYKKALEDWERLMGIDTVVLGAASSQTKTLAVEGARRSRKMLEPPSSPRTKSTPSSSSAPSTSRPKPKAQHIPTNIKPSNPDKSAAVAEMRKAAAAQETEDTQKLALKDNVDAKLFAWKGGKETNLRALMASLDLVLWDSMMGNPGMKVGIHELITEKQVKIKYMKVIARLHPDKLDTKNTTVEQRMLANGAFGALNDAWQAFQNPS